MDSEAQVMKIVAFYALHDWSMGLLYTPPPIDVQSGSNAACPLICLIDRCSLFRIKKVPRKGGDLKNHPSQCDEHPFPGMGKPYPEAISVLSPLNRERRVPFRFPFPPSHVVVIKFLATLFTRTSVMRVFSRERL
jgi:hypothetical protein